MSVDKYLNQLIDDKQVLVDALVEKGVEASSDETFTSLVPKVNDISGGGKYAPRRISFYNYGGVDLDDELSNLDTSKITDMSYMFYGCRSLKSLDISNFNTSNVTSMYSMFEWTEALQSLNLGSIDVSKVTDMRNMFRYTSLPSIDLSNFNTSSLQKVEEMFYYAKQLNTINFGDNFDMSKVTNMTKMFYGCSKLPTILGLNKLDTSNVTNMSYLFCDCSQLNNPDLSGFDTSKVTDMSYMFRQYSTSYIKNLDLSSFNMQSVTNVIDMFGGYISSLSALKFGENLGKGYTSKSANNYYYKLDLSKPRLDKESLMSVINNLYDLNLTYDVANGGTLYTQTLTLGSTNLAKLTAEEIAIATAKGWTVS